MSAGLCYPSLRIECLDLLGAEPLDVEGVAGDEMAQPFQRLSRADQAAGAAPHRLALFPHRVAAALRTDIGWSERLAIVRPLLLDHADDLRNHIAGALHHHGVAGADVLARNLVLVVERRAGNGDAADVHRLKLCDRSQRPGAPDRDRDAVEHGLGLLGRELVGDGPAWRAAGGAETLLPIETVDLEDDAVDLEVERGPRGLDLPMERARLLKAGAAPGERRQREPPRVKPCEDVLLPLPQRLARLTPTVGEEAQPALGCERRVDLAQTARGGVARIHERLFAFRLPLPVQRREICETYVHFAPNLQPFGYVVARERVRQVAQCLEIGGHVLAGLAIASGGAEHELARLVVQRRREAVDLGLAVEHDRLVFPEIEEAPDAALELGQVVVVERVAERRAWAGCGGPWRSSTTAVRPRDRSGCRRA